MISKAELVEILQNNGFEEEAIQRILNKKIKTLLEKGKYENIEKIFEVLKEKGISKEVIENCLSVLARGKADEIEKIFEILNKNNISVKQFNDIFLLKYVTKVDLINEIFSKEPVYIKDYMLLKGIYNRVVSIEEIEKVCGYKKASKDEFIRDVLKDNMVDLYKQVLREKKSIYVGKSIPISKDYMENNGKVILDIAKGVTNNFCYENRIKDKEEVLDFAIDVLLSKCGDITYNLDCNEEMLRRCLYNKCKKYLHTYKSIQNTNISLYEIPEDRNKLLSYNDTVDEDISFEEWNVDKLQNMILANLSKVLEDGYKGLEVFEKVAEKIGMEVDEIIEQIEEIRLKNESKALKRDNLEK